MNLDALVGAVPGVLREETFGMVSVDVPAAAWHDAVRVTRDELGCDFLDFLSAVDEGDGVRVVCHLVRLSPFGHLLVRTLLPADRPHLASVEDLYPGAGWHERETGEMFGVGFTGADGHRLVREHLLLGDDVEGHPLRKTFALRDRLDRSPPGETG
jgi:NADH:ubiquinone oxidoreductase subunit C